MWKNKRNKRMEWGEGVGGSAGEAGGTCAKALWHSGESGLRNYGRPAWPQGREQREET